MHYIFQSERLGFRKWKVEDQAPFVEMGTDKLVMEFFPTTLTAQESIAYINKINKVFNAYGYGLYAVDELKSNEFIGFIGFWHPSFESEFTPCIEIGWRLKSAKWNKGFATEGAKRCLQYGFEVLNFTTVYSLTSKINIKSQRIMQKIGMQKVLEFEHPLVEDGHRLKKHVLYRCIR